MGYTVVSIVEVEVDLKAGMSQVCSPVRQTHVNNTTLEPKARNILFDSSIEHTLQLQKRREPKMR